MANPEPAWEEYDSREDSDEETETEEEEDDGRSKDDNFQEKEKFNTEKEGDNWLSQFIKRAWESSPIEIQQPQRNGFKQNDNKELDYDKEEDNDIPHHSQELNPCFEKEKENGLEDGGEQREFKENSEEVNINRKEYNKNITYNTEEEYDHVTDYSKHQIFKEKGKENEIYLTSDEENFQIDSEDSDLFEEADDEQEEDIKFDYSEYPEEKPIPFGEDKPDVIDPEMLELVDGKDGEPDPKAFAPLDPMDGVRIGDKRWKEMMEQIMYTSPYEDYVPPENKPPHESIWEKWERADFSEGRWVDDFEFDDPNIAPDFTMDFEEIKRLAKLMQEGKPLPYNY